MVAFVTRCLALAFLSMLIAGCVATAILAPPAAAPESPDQSLKQQSDLRFEPDHVDIGQVKEGDAATASLRLRNTGSRMLEIVDIQASCGCTTAEPQDRVLMPDGFTMVHVRIDTFAKQDSVHKWIQVTDSEGKITRATLTLKVHPNPHMATSGRSIFDKPCASCHYDPALGKRDGASIYAAVCVMCHGVRGQGAYAPKLAGRRDQRALQSMIAHGTGDRHMPGFARQAGGPLDANQIAALSAWLVSLDD